MGSSRDHPPSHSEQKPAESTHGKIDCAASKQQHFGNKGPKRRGPAFACAHLRKPPKWNIGIRMNSSYDNGFPMISTSPRHALIWTQVQFSKTCPTIPGTCHVDGLLRVHFLAPLQIFQLSWFYSLVESYGNCSILFHHYHHLDVGQTLIVLTYLDIYRPNDPNAALAPMNFQVSSPAMASASSEGNSRSSSCASSRPSLSSKLSKAPELMKRTARKRPVTQRFTDN